MNLSLSLLRHLSVSLQCKMKKTHVSPLIPSQCITQATCLQTNTTGQNSLGLHLTHDMIPSIKLLFKYLHLDCNRK